jgi:hypothetical protein
MKTNLCLGGPLSRKNGRIDFSGDGRRVEYDYHEAKRWTGRQFGRARSTISADILASAFPRHLSVRCHEWFHDGGLHDQALTSVSFMISRSEGCG